jgi:hypothetical protein
MKRTTIFIDPEQGAALKKLCTGRIPMSEHIRRALDMYLSQPAIQEALKAAPPSADV